MEGKVKKDQFKQESQGEIVEKKWPEVSESWTTTRGCEGLLGLQECQKHLATADPWRASCWGLNWLISEEDVIAGTQRDLLLEELTFSIHWLVLREKGAQNRQVCGFSRKYAKAWEGKALVTVVGLGATWCYVWGWGEGESCWDSPR